MRKGRRNQSRTPLLALFPAEQWQPLPVLSLGTGSPFSSPGTFPSEWQKKPRAPTMGQPAAKPGAGLQQVAPGRSGRRRLSLGGRGRQSELQQGGGPGVTEAFLGRPRCRGGQPQGAESPRPPALAAAVPSRQQPSGTVPVHRAQCSLAALLQPRGVQAAAHPRLPCPRPRQLLSLLVLCPTCGSQAGPAPYSFPCDILSPSRFLGPSHSPPQQLALKPCALWTKRSTASLPPESVKSLPHFPGTLCWGRVWPEALRSPHFVAAGSAAKGATERHAALQTQVPGLSQLMIGQMPALSSCPTLIPSCSLSMGLY